MVKVLFEVAFQTGFLAASVVCLRFLKNRILLILVAISSLLVSLANFNVMLAVVTLAPPEQTAMLELQLRLWNASIGGVAFLVLMGLLLRRAFKKRHDNERIKTFPPT